MFAHNLTRAEATERSALLRDPEHPVDYRISLDLTGADGAGRPLPQPETTFASTTAVTFRSRDAGETHLDLIAERVVEASLDGEPLDPASYDGARLPFRVTPGEHRLVVRAVCRYSRSGQGLHRFVDPADDRLYLYTQFEVSDARRVFGTFEQPDLKGRYTLDVRAPADWTVIGNTVPEQQPADPDPQGAPTALWRFPTSAVFSTYLVGLVAGHYAVVTDEHTTAAGRLPMSVLCRRSVLDDLDADRVFAITKAGFDVFEEAFGFAYPFGKYDQAFVPEYNMGAMENVGCVTLRDDLVFRSRTTRASYESRDNTILHELAHMWFGDLVTMTWWDDLWLKESFAEWASHHAQSQIDATTTSADGRPGDGLHAWATFANGRKTWAYRQDQLPSTHPIAADMVDLEAVESNFDGITYAKGASVLRQLVAYVGRDEFLAGARAYFARHAYGNTRLDDLLAVLTEASGRDLSGWSGQWLETSGVNTLRPVFETDDAGVITRFAVEQDGAVLRDHRVAVGLYRRTADGRLSRAERVEIDVTGARTEVPDLVGLARPELLLVNDDDLTYAKVRLDAVSTTTLTTDLHRLDSSLARAVCWGAAWDMCRDAELPATDYVRIVLAGVGVEDDLTAVRAVLAQAQTAIDSYTPVADRPGLAEEWEAGLAGLLAAAEPGSDHQLALARAYASAVTGDSGAAVLSGWLAGDGVPGGLVVDTDLRWWVLIRLARLGAATSAQIDEEQFRDATVTGAELAAAARAALPDAGAKAAAWRAAVTDNAISNAQQRMVCAAFWQPGQDEVLAPYRDRYRDLALDISRGSNGWAAKGTALQENALGGLFPRLADDPSAVEDLAAWAERVELTPKVRRRIVEGLDDARRAVRAQQAAARVGA
ncbi:aminopeptidase N [Friedmanniella endophytica]|uniref:Aminopeptidase N n=1 Tax=Microlunatus kandeliicorticis TaxID=1759536 RepID=A0A7W3P7J6_9ACTN|nr:aminopeptidase N [Microlunatus kandeliicorticis]MBA8796094.1 aminopeptidase N [Microlunatus kandeliicorticis]